MFKRLLAIIELVVIMITFSACACIGANHGGDSHGGQKDDNNNQAGIRPKINDEVIIYTLDIDTLEKKAIEILFTKEELETLTLYELLCEVVAALEDQSFMVSIKNAYFDNGFAVVDFEKDKDPSTSVEGAETKILDIIAQSILENYEYCNGVIYRIDGEAYRTSEIILELNQVYMGN